MLKMEKLPISQINSTFIPYLVHKNMNIKKTITLNYTFINVFLRRNVNINFHMYITFLLSHNV